MINIIYGLRDPRNDVYQYIGKSTVGIKRPLTHLTKSHSPLVNEWVEMLSKKFMYPQIDIIEEVLDLDELADREKYWIAYYADINPDIFNVASVPDIVETRSDKDEKDFEDLVRIISNSHNIFKKERTYRELTQDDIAKIIDVSRSTIVLFEKGENVNISVLKKYALALKDLDIKTKVSAQRVRK